MDSKNNYGYILKHKFYSIETGQVFLSRYDAELDLRRKMIAMNLVDVEVSVNFICKNKLETKQGFTLLTTR